MKRPDQNFSAAAWFYRALAIFVVAACVATFGAWPIVRSYDSSRIDVIEARERGYAEAAVLEMQNAFLELLGDLRVAASLPAMTHFLDQGEPEREDALARVFRSIMDAYGR